MLDGDPNFDVVTTELRRLRALYAGNDKLAPVVHPVLQLSAPSAKELLPGFAFYVIAHDQRRRRGVPADEPLGLGVGLSWVLAISPDRRLWRLAGSGNYSDFGSLLAARRVVLQSEDDAALIWQAFCELHSKPWQAYPFRQVSRDEWHLGITEGSQARSYYGVSLARSGIVTKAQLYTIPKQ